MIIENIVNLLLITCICKTNITFSFIADGLFIEVVIFEEGFIRDVDNGFASCKI